MDLEKKSDCLLLNNEEANFIKKEVTREDYVLKTWRPPHKKKNPKKL